jgi:hypothetical protein
MTEEGNFFLSKLALERIARESNYSQCSENRTNFAEVILERTRAVYDYIVDIHDTAGKTQTFQSRIDLSLKVG